MTRVHILIRHSRDDGSIVGIEAVIADETKAYTELTRLIALHQGKVLFSLEYRQVT